MSSWRGHCIVLKNGEWFYLDGTAVKEDAMRTCGYCKLPNREDEHDACLGKLPGVVNACCGHGDTHSSYIQFENNKIIRGFKSDE